MCDPTDVVEDLQAAQQKHVSLPIEEFITAAQLVHDLGPALEILLEMWLLQGYKAAAVNASEELISAEPT